MKKSIAIVCSLFVLAPAAVSAFQIQFSQGYNLAGIPSGTGSPVDSTELMESLGGSDKVLSAGRHDPQTGFYQEAYFVDGVLQGEPFTLSPSEGYVVRMKGEASLDYDASFTCSSSMDLHPGLNLIALPCANGQFTAFQLLLELGGPTKVSSVQRYSRETGLFETASFFGAGFAGKNFPLMAGEGTFVFMKETLSGWQPFVDSDEDGSPDSEDCDPVNPAVYPGAEEICGDQVDNDCSGRADDRDSDGDGYVTVDCGGEDVDDSDALVNPGAREICGDGLDNDSDGLKDDQDPACGPGCDEDNDGHPSGACGGLDYADHDSSTYPGADEICGDGRDNDLDGRIDEGCGEGGPYFTPQNAKFLAGDTVLFQVVDDQENTEWVYQVNGITGGSESVGLIERSQARASLAVFTAPPASQILTVTVSAVDPNHETRSASATATIYPIIGEYIITPASVTIGLGRTINFQAGLEVGGLGFLPLHDVYWKVNGVLKGNPGIGTIDPFGNYRAPATMPDSLPAAIFVGFSFTPEGAVAKAVPVTLAKLVLSPKLVKSIQEGKAETLSGVLEKSDATSVNPVPAGELAFFSDNGKAVSVNQAGDVIICKETGKAVISAVHKATLARDAMVVHSLSDIRLSGEVVRRSNDYARIERDDTSGVTEIEFTRPGAFFNFLPRATYLRGSSAGDEVSGAAEVVSFTGDGTKIVDYDESGAVPHPTGVVAIVERNSGFVTIGDLPGSGTMTATYNDGDLVRQVSMTVIFTRLEMSVTALGEKSQSATEAYITEFINVEVTLSNPTGSGFVGRTPIKVTLPDGDSFHVVYGINVNTGAGNSMATTNLYTGSGQAPAEFLLSAASTLDPFEWMPAHIRFKLSPRKVGENYPFQFAVANDSGIPVQSATITIKRPTLLPGLGLDPTSPIVVNSWVQVVDNPLEPYGVSVFDLYTSDSVFGFAHNDPPHWYITDPNQNQMKIPVTDDSSGFFTFTPTQAGQYRIFMGLTDRPELRSEELLLNVVDPSSVAGASITEEAARFNQLGTYKIITPLGGAWLTDRPISVTVNTYGADGIAKTVGVTHWGEDGEGNSFITGHEVVGISLHKISGPEISITGLHYPADTSGIVALTVTPTTITPRSDLILQIGAQVHSLQPQEFSGVLPVDQSYPLYAEFVDSMNNSYRSQFIRLGGHGLLTEPRQIPVASSRVRQYVSEGKLDPSVLEVNFSVIGTEGFADSLQSGLAGADLGQGVHLEKSSAQDGKLLMTVTADPDTALGSRTILLTFNDGKTWEGALELYAFEIDKAHDHGDINLPLNASHHQMHPVGSQVFRVTPEAMEDPERAIQKLEVEIVPSIKPGDVFRGATAENPIVGLRREIDPQTGAIRVSEDNADLFHHHNAYFLVYGNTTDRRRLTETGSLSAPGDPDFLPDFVSPTPGAEKLFLKLKGNLVDCLFFTAYNLVAKVKEDLPDPGLEFDDDLKDSIGTAYVRYSGFPAGATVKACSEDSRNRSSVAVDVDKEADILLGNLDFERNRFTTSVPHDYFAGILDQYYLTELGEPIGQDGRVSPFDGDRSESIVVTGRNRRSFGIELAAVLYDPRIWGSDEVPNSDGLLSIPVVDDLFPGGAARDPVTHLLKDQGGTSGGYFDLDREVPASHFIVAKTPAAEFPGLHGGYLINGTPEDLTDPYTGSVEDDMGDVILKRSPQPDQVDAPLVEEEIGFGIKQPRRVMAYGRNEDKKLPMRTALRSSFGFLITTDPEGVGAGSVNPVKVKGALMIREKPAPATDFINLLVTTQSSGSEGMQKALLDTAVDLAVDVSAAVILNVATGGGSSALCGAEIGRDLLADVGTAFINASLNSLESELIEPYGTGADQNLVTISNGLLNDGTPVDPLGLGVQVSMRDIIVNNRTDEEIKANKFMVKKWKINDVKSIGVCALLKAPFNQLKDTIKGSFSVEDLGGNGSAEAFGMKSMALSIPASARAEGVPFNVFYSISRRIHILPEEPYHHELSEWPDFDLDAAVTSDLDLIARLIDDTSDPATAKTILKRIAIQSVYREPKTHTDKYVGYKLRYSRIPSLEGVIVPKADMGEGQVIPDFELEVGKTVMPFAAASVVTASRSNQNASARASIRSPGYEMLLINAYIPTLPEN